MNPVLLKLGPITIRWYGAFAALGFLAGFRLVQYRAHRTGFGRGRAADLSLATMVGGLGGARILYVLQHWSEFRDDLLEVIRIDHGGLVFYGGFIGAVLSILGICAWKGWSFRRVADLFAPAAALGHAFGRIGCLLNGCCFGRPWSGPLALRYPPDGSVLFVQIEKGLLSGGAQACLPVFPIQLIAALFNVGLCVVLLRAEKHLRAPGQLFGLYLTLYAAGRFVMEFGRGDYLAGLGPFTPAQGLCFWLLPAGVAWFAVMPRLARRCPAPRDPDVS